MYWLILTRLSSIYSMEEVQSLFDTGSYFGRGGGDMLICGRTSVFSNISSFLHTFWVLMKMWNKGCFKHKKASFLFSQKTLETAEFTAIVHVLYIDWNHEKCHRDIRSDTNQPILKKVQHKNHFWSAYHGHKINEVLNCDLASPNSVYNMESPQKFSLT